MNYYDIVLKELGLSFNPHQINVNNKKRYDGSVSVQKVAFYTSSMRTIFRLDIDFDSNTANSFMFILGGYCSSNSSHLDLNKIRHYKQIVDTLKISTFNDICANIKMDIVSLKPFKVTVSNVILDTPPFIQLDPELDKKMIPVGFIENVDTILEHYGLSYNNPTDLEHILTVFKMLAI